jgi:hypothetical protein
LLLFLIEHIWVETAGIEHKRKHGKGTPGIFSCSICVRAISLSLSAIKVSKVRREETTDSKGENRARPLTLTIRRKHSRKNASGQCFSLPTAAARGHVAKSHNSYTIDDKSR